MKRTYIILNLEMMILPSKGEGNQNAKLRQAARPRGGGGEKKGQLNSINRTMRVSLVNNM